MAQLHECAMPILKFFGSAERLVARAQGVVIVNARREMAAADRQPSLCAFCRGRRMDFEATPIRPMIAVQDHLSASLLRSNRPKRATPGFNEANRQMLSGTMSARGPRS